VSITMSAVFIARAIGLLSVSFILGALILVCLSGSPAEAGAREWRRRLIRASGLSAVLLGVTALVLLLSSAPIGHGAPALVAHVMATVLWAGLLLPLCLAPQAKASRPTDHIRSVTAWSAMRTATLALTFATVAAAGIAWLVWTLPGGPPALAGTRYGRFLLAQAILVGLALVLLARMTVASYSAPLRHTDSANAVLRLAVLAPASLLGLASVALAAALVGFPVSRAEPVVWPFAYRFAPAIMWNSPFERSRAIVGLGIFLAGLLILSAAVRLRSMRPLLIAGGILFVAAGAHQALISLSIDAYPTTYARPTVSDTPASVLRGRELFLANCAVCHGSDGRGDGPAAPRLLQRPADLRSPHTADHTPGDIFWWVTHGLGLAMPPFGDRLSVDERWDIVNFVRTLPKPLPRRVSSRILGPVR
jgi:putative copper resistance protein D